MNNFNIFLFSFKDRLKPNVNYGRMDHKTELIIAPNLYKGIVNSSSMNDTKQMNGFAKPSLNRSQTTAKMGDSIDTNLTDDDNKNTSLMRSTTESSMKQLTRSQSKAKVHRQDKLARVLKDLKRESTQSFELRVITGKWPEKAQMSDVFITQSQLPEFMDLEAMYHLKTPNDKEYYVKVRIDQDSDLPNTIHPTLAMNANLMKVLELKELEKVILKPKTIVVNFVEKLELFAYKKTHYKIVENAFKRYVIERTIESPMLINQGEVVRLEDELLVTVGIIPDHFRYCVVDAQFLKECKIYAADLVKKVEEVPEAGEPALSPLSVKDLIELPEYNKIMEEIIIELKTSLCLDGQNSVLRQGNVLISGASGTGKSVLTERVIDHLMKRPFYCYFDIFYCVRSKGRKVKSQTPLIF